MITQAEWSKKNIDVIFRYALEYISETHTIPTPKFHMIDSQNRMAIISCDFWNDHKDYDSLKTILDRFVNAFGAVSSLLVVSGRVNHKDMIGIVTYSSNEPKIYIKQIIQHKSIVDFGPTTIMPVDQIDNFVNGA